MSSADGATPELSALQSAAGVRAAATRVYDYVASGGSDHFTLNLTRLNAVVELVLDVTHSCYPDAAAIPFHSRLGHFDAGGVARLGRLEERLKTQPTTTRRRCLADLVITSVLLDAGAGAQWRYDEPHTGQHIARSEGLAVASYWWFASGGLSNDPTADVPRADARRLANISQHELVEAFQVNEDNPLVGVAGRVELLQRLGAELTHDVRFQTRGEGKERRPCDVLNVVPMLQGRVRANDVLDAVLQGFGSVWPGRETLHGVNLGDVWTHSKLGRIPFHKLSQWLTYSLCDVLQRTGVDVVQLDALTGLAEYRNGGLFLDLGVITPRDAMLTSRAHAVGSDVVIEWRALTVALLDATAKLLRQRLSMTSEQLPLVKVLEGGTWRAGRKVAMERRSDASPPLQLISDGTVF
jgi:hypothetical protein